jgi:hypothetical protein
MQGDGVRTLLLMLYVLSGDTITAPLKSGAGH